MALLNPALLWLPSFILTNPHTPWCWCGCLETQQQLNDLGTCTLCGWLSLHYARSLYKGPKQMEMDMINKRRLKYEPIHLHHGKTGNPHCMYLDHQTREWKTSIALSTPSCEPAPHFTIIFSRLNFGPSGIRLVVKSILISEEIAACPTTLYDPSIAPDGQPDRSRTHAEMNCMCRDLTTARICLDLAFGACSRTLTMRISVPGSQGSSS